MSSLATLELDDLDFRALTTGVVERIPAESGGQWTLHAPVDPGITLLDLFAYLLDQRVYWLDQIPDALLRGIFRLLGDAPRHAKPAAAVFQLDDSAASSPIDLVQDGVRLALVGGTDDVLFTTGAKLALLRAKRVEVEVADVDRTADVLRGRAVELFPADGSPAAVRFGLALSGILPAIVGQSASLLLRLATSSQLAPQWVATDEALAVGPPAALTWSYRSTAGGTRSLTVDDGTGGFRRSGVVRFVVPADWQPDAPPGPDGVSVRSIYVTTEAATFTAPPRLVEVVPNVAAARHAARERLPSELLERQLDEWLPLPGLTIELGAPGRVLDEPGTLRVRLRERDGHWRRWEATADLAFHGPGDRVFVVDRSAGALRFGDGLTGRIPRLQSQAARARVRFQLGGGPSGNVGASLSWEAENPVGLTARNVVSAEGGTEPETLVEARERIRASLTRRDRAVTPRDFESIAESTVGVDIERAHAAVGFHPDYPCTLVPGAVTVFIVPDAPRDVVAGETFVAAPEPDPGALEAVAARLEAARLVGTEVFVRPPRYRSVRLAVAVRSEPPDASELRERLDRELRSYLDPLEGGDESQGWPFGEPLRPSALLRRAQAAVGFDADLLSVAVGLDGAPPDEDCRDVAIGPHDLVVAVEVSVRWLSAAGTEGGLR